MNQFRHEEILRTVGVLKDKLGVTSRDNFAHKLDDGADARDLEGIGEKRAPIVAALWGLSEGDWVQWTGLPYYEEAQSE